MTSTVPTHLIPLELEREFLAAAFHAALELERQPGHGPASLTLEALVAFDASDLVYREHRELLHAIQEVFARTGSVSPAIVHDELRRRRHFDALRLLPTVVTYPWAPLASIAVHVSRLEQASCARREWARTLDQQATLLHGEVVEAS